MAPTYSLAEQLRQADSVIGMVYGCLGLFVTEVITSIALFDWYVWRGIIPFRWSLILYWLSRIGTVLVLIGNLTTSIGQLGNSLGPINCRNAAHMAQLGIHLSTCASSMTLALRAMAVREMALKPVLLIGSLALIQFLLFWPIYFTGSDNPAVYPGNCTIQAQLQNPFLYASFFLYSLLFDTFVLIATLLKLFSMGTRLGGDRGGIKGGIGSYLMSQGITYFILTIVTTIPVVILEFMQISYVVIATVTILQITLNSIVACRLIAGLQVSSLDSRVDKPYQGLKGLSFPDLKSTRSDGQNVLGSIKLNSLGSPRPASSSVGLISALEIRVERDEYSSQQSVPEIRRPTPRSPLRPESPHEI